MQIQCKYRGIKGFVRLYNYANKQNCMITKTAKERHEILKFWWEFGGKATLSACGAKRSTLYEWQRKLRKEGMAGLNPGIQARKSNNKRIINPLVLKEIRRLRFDVCPNLGKDKVKRFLDKFCAKHEIKVISVSTIGRIIKDKKIYHHRQKVTHFGKIKNTQRAKRLRKPNDFKSKSPGELVEIDTVVRFIGKTKRYIVTAIDTYGRITFARCYSRATSNNTRDFFKELQTASPFAIKAIQTDNGSEFHKYFMNYLKEEKITHYWNYPGRPYRNGHVEKFNRTIQEEFVDWNEIWLDDSVEFNQKLMVWLIWYNTERPHWSLGLQSPMEYLINNGYQSNMR